MDLCRFLRMSKQRKFSFQNWHIDTFSAWSFLLFEGKATVLSFLFDGQLKCERGFLQIIYFIWFFLLVKQRYSVFMKYKFVCKNIVYLFYSLLFFAFVLVRYWVIFTLEVQMLTLLKLSRILIRTETSRKLINTHMCLWYWIWLWKMFERFSQDP